METSIDVLSLKRKKKTKKNKKIKKKNLRINIINKK